MNRFGTSRGRAVAAACAAAALLVIACVAVAGFARAREAVRIGGTLYLLRPAGGLDFDLITMRNGVVIRTSPEGRIPLVARHDPAVSLTGGLRFGGTHVSGNSVYTDDGACMPIAISPNGVNAACVRIDGRGTLAIFRVADAARSQKNTTLRVGQESAYMAGFLSDDRLAVAADDRTCPFFRRSDGRYAGEPQARLRIIDMHGSIVRSGPCVHGLVAGDGKLAYLSHDAAEMPLYSLDGATWSRGTPAAFDGRGELLLIDRNGDLVDRADGLVANRVSAAYWTK